MERVWLKRYPEGVPAGSIQTCATLVEMFEESVTSSPSARLRQHGEPLPTAGWRSSPEPCRLPPKTS